MSFLEKQELHEFESFLASPTATVDSKTENRIFAARKQAQRDYKLQVFGKLVTIHAVVSFLSLAVCHQFGVNPFNSSVSLSDYFMHFGHSVCMLFCGFIFVGTSVLMARALLNRNEFVLIRNSYPLQIFALCSLSLGAFVVSGAHMHLSIVGLWIVGAFIGSALPTFIPSPKTA